MSFFLKKEEKQLTFASCRFCEKENSESLSNGGIGSKLCTLLMSAHDMTVSNMKKHFYSNHADQILSNELQEDPNFRQKKINGASSLAQVFFFFFSSSYFNLLIKCVDRLSQRV